MKKLICAVGILVGMALVFMAGTGISEALKIGLMAYAAGQTIIIRMLANLALMFFMIGAVGWLAIRKTVAFGRTSPDVVELITDVREDRLISLLDKISMMKNGDDPVVGDDKIADLLGKILEIDFTEMEKPTTDNRAKPGHENAIERAIHIDIRRPQASRHYSRRWPRGCITRKRRRKASL